MTTSILAGIIILILNIISIFYNYKKKNYIHSVMAAACGGLVLGVLLMQIK